MEENNLGGLSKVKCFNCDFHGHLVENYPKPPQVNEISNQAQKILQERFEAKTSTLGEISNLLKLKCVINDNDVCWFLDSRVTNFFLTSQNAECLGIKIEEVDNHILVHMAQGMTKLMLRIMLGIKLLIGGVQLFEIFTLCDLDSFEAIIKNTFLDAYEIDIVFKEQKIRIHAKGGF
jgi:hypothetical protein